VGVYYAIAASRSRPAPGGPLDGPPSLTFVAAALGIAGTLWAAVLPGSPRGGWKMKWVTRKRIHVNRTATAG
jgi:hypothetical protein